MSWSRTGKTGSRAQRLRSAGRRNRPSTALIRHLVVCRMQIWQPADTDSAPAHQVPYQALDPLVQMVLLGGPPPPASLPVHPWWEDTVQMALSTSPMSKRRLALTPSRPVGESAPSTGASLSHPIPSALSAREQEILQLVAEGLPNKAIADQLILAESTVKWYLKQIYLKLDVHNRVQAIGHLHSSK
jgi:DNA-binding NarL/FixJ family response regulator